LNDLFLYLAIGTVFHPSGIIQNGRIKLLSKSHVQSSNYMLKLFFSLLFKICSRVLAFLMYNIKSTIGEWRDITSLIFKNFRFEFYNRAKTAFAIVATGKDYYIDGQNTQLIFFLKCPIGGGNGCIFWTMIFYNLKKVSSSSI
jgi:hypothetical protein